MSPYIPLAIIAAVLIVGIFIARNRRSSGGSGGIGGSRGRPGADKH